jgi:hypothetical protein
MLEELPSLAAAFHVVQRSVPQSGKVALSRQCTFDHVVRQEPPRGVRRGLTGPLV